MKKENKELEDLVKRLFGSQKPIWKKVAKELSRPKRKKITVNLEKINKYAQEGSTVLVPGKVLGSGELSKKMTIAAFAFSQSAKQLIIQCGAKAVSIDNLVASNPNGKDVLIIK